MNKIYLLALLALIIPTATALEITAPTNDITAQELPTTVHISWEGNSTNYQLTLENKETTLQQETLSTTSTNYELEAGEYTLTITGDSESDTKQFSITQEELIIDLQPDKNEYQEGDIIKLIASSNKEVYAEVDIYHENELKTTYKGDIPEDIIPTTNAEAGNYHATLTAQEQQVTTTWVVHEKEATPELDIDFTHEEAIINQPTHLVATATGGKSPYTYQWSFSDGTNNKGKEINHYFFEEGDIQATLIVTDDTGQQKTNTKQLTVYNEDYEEETQQLHTLEINVIDELGNPRSGLNTTIHHNNQTQQQTTNEAGLARFEELETGNYQLTIKHRTTTQINEVLTIEEDTNKVYTIPRQPTNQTEPEEPEEETNTTEETNQTEPEEETPEPELTAQEQQDQQLEETRQQTIAELEERRFNFQLASKQDATLIHLQLYELFDEAKTTIQEATNQQTITRALRNVPEEVTIKEEENKIIYPDKKDLQEAIETFLDAENIEDEKIREQYRYNIQQQTPEVSIQSDSYTAVITYANKEETYRIINKKITAPENSRYIEIIPSEIATNINELHIQGDYEVVRENPILEFRTNEYSYSAQSNQKITGQTIILPKTLDDKPLFSGLAAVRLGESDPMRSLFYLLIIGLFAAGIFAGKKINEHQEQQALFEDFYELASQAADLSAQGNNKQVSKLTPHITEIYNELPADQQEQCKEIILHLTSTKKKHEFTQTINSIYETVKNSNGDINEISSAYEQALNEYEQLPQTIQEDLREHLQVLEGYLDEHITT